MKTGDKPAYPQTIDDMGTMRSVTEGMTLREYYAGLAMQGIIIDQKTNDKATCKDIAKWSCEYADALIAELDKTRNKK